MTLLLLSLVKVSAVLLAGLMAAALLRRRSAAVRHWVLVVAIACAAAAPMLQLVVPAWTLERAPVPSAQAGALEFFAPASSAAPASPAPLSDTTLGAATVLPLVVPVWLTGCGVSLALLVLALARLRRIERGATPVTTGIWLSVAGDVAREYGLAPVALLQTTHPALLVTWGWRRARVLLPSGAERWPESRVHLVLRHELAHVQRGDWMAQMLGELLRSVYWFNPLVWVACRRLRQESEQACDDRVLRSGVDPSVYASELLDVARAFDRHARTWTPMPAAARPSTLRRRIHAMLSPHLDRRPAAGSLRVVLPLVLFALTLSAAGFGLEPSPATVGAADSAPETNDPAQTDDRSTVDDRATGAVPSETEPVLPQSTAPASSTASTIAGTIVDPSGGAATGAVPSETEPVLPQSAAPAPSTASTITGRIVDPSGGLLPGVQVSLTRRHNQQREARSTYADSNGAFRLTDIPVGEHDLQLTLPGFATLIRRISVDADESAHYDLALRVGSLQETVTVGNGTRSDPALEQSRQRAAEAIREAAARVQSERALEPTAPISPRVPGMPVRVGGNIRAPRKTTDVWPWHPTSAPGATGGVVALQVRIGENGRVEALVPLWSSSEDLTVAASTAVWQWEFTPTLLNGRPIAADMFVTVHFTGS